VSLWRRIPRFQRLRIPLRLRFFFRSAFVLLIAATLALALSVLQDEKERSHRVYAESLSKSGAQIAARLRHPTGQLALLNPGLVDRPPTPLRPVVLPFAALDFDDRAKAMQAVEMAGCAVQYADGATLCLAVGNKAYGGGFVYAVGSFNSPALVPHLPPELDLSTAHRVALTVNYRGQATHTLAAYQIASDGRGRLAAFSTESPLLPNGARPLRDFRGWLWQNAVCDDAASTAGDCVRRSHVSLRLPVDALTQLLLAERGNESHSPNWPPADIASMTVRLQVLPPGEGAALFDSDAAGATMASSLSDLKPLLLPGETLGIQREDATQALATLKGEAATDEPISPWVAAIIRRLPTPDSFVPLRAQESIATPLGRYQVSLGGDLRSVNRPLAAVATRLLWTVGAMLAAIALVWLALEVVVIRRMTLLTQRAAVVSRGMKGNALAELDLSDLKGSDELGVLAQGLKDLLAKVQEHVQREQIRAQQERDQWHAVGHEIVSPLQSLKALHGQLGDPAERYITRMQEAVRVIYGQASPSEAFEAKAVDLQPLDLNAFFSHVAANAHYVDIDNVHYVAQNQAVPVLADEYALEDVVGHVLRNAQRHRKPGSAITMRLAADAALARVHVHNQGEPISETMLERIFEYGVSQHNPSTQGEQRGQGLFVAKTYMAKMGGTIHATNTADGVEFVLQLPRGG
jgi:signal transduction histidine kinase